MGAVLWLCASCTRNDDSAKIEALSQKIDSISYQSQQIESNRFELIAARPDELVYRMDKITGKILLIAGTQGQWVKIPLTVEEILQGLQQVTNATEINSNQVNAALVEGVIQMLRTNYAGQSSLGQ